jgi:ATP-binding cassette subfamily G (WHITE) protein 2 (PDR)
MYRSAVPTDSVSERGVLTFLLIWTFFLLASAFTSMVIAGVDTVETGGSIANSLFLLCINFCGVIAPASTLPAFWIFMYRVSPFTYLVSAMLSTGIANTKIYCADNEFLHFERANSQTCAAYMQSFISDRGGYLGNPQATSDYNYCPLDNTNTFLSNIGSSYSTRWRVLGIMWAFIVFNFAAAIGLYWLMRVPKEGRKRGNKQ